MKYRWRLGKIPDGNTPLANQSVAVRRISDGATLTTLLSDANGFIELNGDGHYPPFFLHLSGVPGGDKYWRSDESHTVGAISPMELPAAFRSLGDGVVRGHLNDLAPSLNGTNLSLATGTALCAGYPVYNGTADQFALTRPVTSTRIDHLVAWVKPLGASSNPGEAGFSVRTGVEGAAVTALVQTADLHEVSLATITVPTAGALALTDTRAFAIEKLSAQDVVRLASITTTNASGEYLTGLIIILTIPRSGDYKIEATLTGQQLETASVTSWVLQNTYGPTFNGLALSSPAQVAKDSTGRILIADTGNGRLVILNTDGTYNSSITGLTGITGVAIDPSSNIYVVFGSVLRKYNSSLVQQWSVTMAGGAVGTHLSIGSSRLFVTVASPNGSVQRRSPVNGGLVATYGSLGASNGQFDTPHGIADDGTLFYVVDSGNSRIQKFTTVDGVYVTQWPISASARGCALDASGNVLVAEYGSDLVKRYTNTGTFIDQFTQTDPSGIGVATGDVPWVSNAGAGTIAKWDQGITAGGYGAIAIEIDGVVSDYIGNGQRDSSVANSATATKTGGGTVVVRAFGKATLDTLTLKSLVLSAKATPQR